MKYLIALLTISLTIVLCIVIWQSPARGQAFIDILRILISWPLAVGILIFVFVKKFPDQIGRLLDRIKSLPGGTELSPMQQPELTKVDEEMAGEGIKEEGKEMTELLDQMRELEEEIKMAETERQAILDYSSELVTELETEKTEQGKRVQDLEEELKKVTNERDEIRNLSTQIIDSCERSADFWKFEYLSLFLVPNTQRVLKWFRDIPEFGIGISSFHNLWKPFILDENQRNVILEILLYFDLLKVEGGYYKITETGKQFLAHMDLKQRPSTGSK